MSKKIKMTFISLGIGLTLALPVTLAAIQPVTAKPENRADKKELRANHPRLEKSIKELQETIDYLQKSPDNFGGHKTKAIDACKAAIAELKAALENAGKKPRQPF